MLTLYDYLDSGNGYKVRLLLAQLGRPYRRIELDIDRGETRTADFLALNPNGRVPTLVLEDGRPLAESNAILCYLAEGSAFLPERPYERALVLQWLFFEQYSHEPYVAVARYILRHLPEDHPRRRQLPALRERGYQALEVMDASSKAGTSWSPTATRSPTSRSMPTRTSPPTAGMTCPGSRRSARGSEESRPSPNIAACSTLPRMGRRSPVARRAGALL